jgi:hypothetical protein
MGERERERERELYNPLSKLFLLHYNEIHTRVTRN